MAHICGIDEDRVQLPNGDLMKQIPLTDHILLNQVAKCLNAKHSDCSRYLPEFQSQTARDIAIDMINGTETPEVNFYMEKS